MSRKSPAIRLEIPRIDEIRNEFAKLPRGLAAITMGAAVGRAMAPAFKQLKSEVSGGVVKKGPTGNLLRSVKIVTRRYKKTGTGVAIVGFQKAGAGKSKSAGGGKVKKGSDRAFHQFWLEFGTADRFAGKPAQASYTRRSRKEFVTMKKSLGAKQAKDLISKTQKVAKQGGFIASSFNSLGPFRFGSAKATKGGRVATNPKYPRAFFKKSAGPVPLGHMVAAAPIHTTWNKTRNAIQGGMEKEIRAGLVAAMNQIKVWAAKRTEKLEAVAAARLPKTPF